jgi:hypothetical protein
MEPAPLPSLVAPINQTLAASDHLSPLNATPESTEALWFSEFLDSLQAIPNGTEAEKYSSSENPELAETDVRHLEGTFVPDHLEGTFVPDHLEGTFVPDHLVSCLARRPSKYTLPDTARRPASSMKWRLKRLILK